MYHKLQIIGNLGIDPELRCTPSGQSVANFTLASNRSWTDGSGNKQTETIWFRISTWGKQAESCAKSLKKGDLIFCEGRLTPDDDGNPNIRDRPNGNPVAKYEVTAFDVKFLKFNDE